MLEAFADAVVSLDPDIVMGWEMQKGSLGYLKDRYLRTWEGDGSRSKL